MAAHVGEDPSLSAPDPFEHGRVAVPEVPVSATTEAKLSRLVGKGWGLDISTVTEFDRSTAYSRNFVLTTVEGSHVLRESTLNTPAEQRLLDDCRLYAASRGLPVVAPVLCTSGEPLTGFASFRADTGRRRWVSRVDA